MTIRNEVAARVERCVFEWQRKFLTEWLKMADKEPWISIPPELCNRVVFRACAALSFAKQDHRAGVDRHASSVKLEHQRILQAISHMRALRDYYDESLAKADPEFTGHTDEDIRALADKVAWCDREGESLIEEARRLKLEHTVHVSNQPVGREKRLFIQRLRSELTEPLFGRPYQELVMDLTDIAYGGETSIDDVKNAWKQMP
jgi:hypothetical protein